MKSLWTTQGEREALERWAPQCGETIARRLYTARLLGQDCRLVLHGGGNVSVKSTQRNLLGEEVETIFVKASGWHLADLEPSGLPGLALNYLRRLRAVDALSDEQLLNELRTHLFDAAAPTPSIETPLHALLPHRYVDHSHADAVLVLANQPRAPDMLREALGQRVTVVPYVRPGLELAKIVVDSYEHNPAVEGIVLLHHGLVTFGEDARTSYERHVALVDACERFIESHPSRAAGCSPRDRLPTRVGTGRSPARRTLAQAEACSSGAASGAVAQRAAALAPVLRGLLAWPTGDEDRPYRRPILEWRAEADILAMLDEPETGSVATAGPMTPDHVMYTRAKPLWVDGAVPSSGDAMRRRLQEAVDAYRHEYAGYLARHGKQATGIDTSPRVILMPGTGLLCWGGSKRAACMTADMAEHTLVTQRCAQAIGRYEPASPEHLCDAEFRSLQRRKLQSPGPGRLQGQVVVISGGAGAIGSAVAEVCAEHGAHVVLADLDAERIARIVQPLEQRFGVGTAAGLVMDVTDETSVREGFEELVRTYGGVDVIVPNAGTAHVAAIEELDVADFRRVMEVNAVGYLLFMREGIRVLKAQGLGGHIIINASKNVFAPGAQFGAYSASKAAAHQLGKVAAKELAPHGIRVNMINADGIFGDDKHPSGLWAAVGPHRAQSRNLRVEDLPEYYRRRNLLQARVTARHVGEAVVFFASNATPTTGATLPIDGGIPEACPR